MSDSIAFDRAAEYYDATRGLSEEGVRHTTEALAEVFRGAGPILEVGVGTGQVALPLHDAGVRVMGVDLSRPMLSKLLAKAGGAPAVPVGGGRCDQPALRRRRVRRRLPAVGAAPDPGLASRRARDRAHPRPGKHVRRGPRRLRWLPAGDAGTVRRDHRHLDRTRRPGMERVGRARRRGRFAGDAEAPRHRVHRSRSGRPRALHAGDRGQPILMDVGGAGRSDARGRGRRGPPLGRGPLGAARARSHPRPSSGGSPSTGCLDLPTRRRSRRGGRRRRGDRRRRASRPPRGLPARTSRRIRRPGRLRGRGPPRRSRR